MSQAQLDIEPILGHVRYLSTILGGRGSCTPVEKRAAEYTAEQMRALDVSDVRLESYQGAPSIYRPFAAAFGLAAFGTLLAWLGWLIETPWFLPLAVLANALAAWGVLAESDLATNWMRWLLPKAESHNAVGVIPAAEQARQRVILSAHVDSHRTPFFYASRGRFIFFRVLVIVAWLGMLAETVLYTLAPVLGWDWVYWFGAVALFQVVAMDIFFRADTTPFSPGANDNASGVGVVLELARRLREKPLAHTEVWLVFTGCEETGAHGMAAFLDAHDAQLGDDAIYVVLDMMGRGHLAYNKSDGLLIKHRTHPRAMELARRVRAALPQFEVNELVGLAYTDALVATKRGRIALTLYTLPPSGDEEAAQWHRMTDTLDNLDVQALADSYAFTWQVLQEVDRA